MKNTVQMDRTTLLAMATIISNEHDADDARLCDIMNDYSFEGSYISHVELMKPDGTILSMDGSVRASSQIDSFEAQTSMGANISSVFDSKDRNGKSIIRNAVPVVKDGHTVYVLFGVIRLSDFAKEFKTDIYDGNAYVFLEDGDTGEFLLDTWHDYLGNINEFSNRKTLPDFSFEQAIDSMKNGVGGRLGFVSRTIGRVVYLHFEPTGINNWNVMVMATQSEAMKESLSISSRLYMMAALIGVIMIVYVACVTVCLARAYRQVRRLGSEDQTTGLQNRNAYDQYFIENQSRTFPSIVCVYMDVNGLHELNNRLGHKAGDKMLREVADALRAEFPFKSVYRVGGDEFVVITDDVDFDACKAKIDSIQRQIELLGYSVSVGIMRRLDELGVDRVTQEADELMLRNKKAYYETHDRRESGR